jgi:translation initiation factor IF-3
MNNPNFGRRFSKDQNFRREDEHRVNFNIRVPQVRVIRDEEQLGIMATDVARRMAMDDGLDLVEIAPTAKPPVCRIMDYGRFKYEQNIKKKETAKKQREAQTHLKEIRLRPGIADHDTDVKIGQAKKFLAEGHRVQFNLQFRGGRELSHKERGYQVMQRIIEALAESGTVEKNPAMEGNRIVCCFTPKN